MYLLLIFYPEVEVKTGLNRVSTFYDKAKFLLDGVNGRIYDAIF
jgi:hypothetical protein